MAIILNGWQRLWVVLSSIYLVVVVMFVAFNFPSPEGIENTSDLLKKLSPQSQALLLIHDRGIIFPDEADIIMPNGALFRFKEGVSETQRSAVVREYWAIVSSLANEQRISLVGRAALWWLGPCMVLYVLGWLFGWVRRGFRGA